MPADVVFRPFNWGDVPAITAIYTHYVHHSSVTFDTEAPSEAQMAEKFAALVSANYPVIIAEGSGGVLGYAYTGLFRPRFAYRFTCEDSLYLHKDAVGQGLGTRLLDELIRQSQAFGFKQMMAVITAGTDNSIRLHQNFGFEQTGYFKALGLKFDRWLDVVYMQRAL